MIKGDPKFRVQDMKVGAMLYSAAVSPTIMLIAAESEIGPDNTVRRVANTGLRVRFEDHRLEVRNKALLRMLLGHPHFNRAGKFGFQIDPQDLTGFWRAQGIVTEKQITVIEEPEGGMHQISPDEVDFRKVPKSVVDVVEEDPTTKPLEEQQVT